MNRKTITIILLAGIALIQFIRIDTTSPEYQKGNEYLFQTQAPKEIGNILKKACYDCHSFETNYPWYSNIAPFSWLVNNHIQEGREHLNFSEWKNYSPEKKISIQEECIKEIEKNKMPLQSYTFIHSEAKLSDTTKIQLKNWFLLQTQNINNKSSITTTQTGDGN